MNNKYFDKQQVFALYCFCERGIHILKASWSKEVEVDLSEGWNLDFLKEIREQAMKDIGRRFEAIHPGEDWRELPLIIEPVEEIKE